jgi:hypothetical protein
MTIKEARNILENDADGLTDNEVQEIIDWLSMMADIAIEAVERDEQQINKSEDLRFYNTK